MFIVTAVYKSRRWESEARQTYRVHEYLEKPIEPEDLLEAIARYFPDVRGLSGSAPRVTDRYSFVFLLHPLERRLHVEEDELHVLDAVSVRQEGERR